MILLLALLLRLWGLGAQPLWMDEVMSLRQAVNPSLGGMIREAADFDNHPPLYALLNFLWLRPAKMRWERATIDWGGDRTQRLDAYVRVPSVVYGVGAVALVMLLGRRLFGRTAGFIAGGLLAVSAFHVYFSQEARPYSLAILLVLALTYCLVRLLDAGPPEADAPVRLWVIYGLLAAACLYTYVLTVLAILTHVAIFILAGRLTRRNLLAGLITGVAVVVAFLPWLPHVSVRVGEWAQMEGVTTPLGPRELLTALGQWLFGPLPLEPAGGPATGLGAAAGLGALGLILLALAAVGAWRRTRLMLLLPLLIVLPLALYRVLPIPRVALFESKHFAFVMPFCLLLLAAPVARRANRLPLALVLGVVVLANLGELAIYHDGNHVKERWGDVVQYLEQVGEERDLIMADPLYANLVLTYHYRGPMPIYGVSRQDAQQLVGAATARLRDGSIERVFLVLCANNVSRPLILTKNYCDPSWRMIDTARFDGLLGGITAFVMTSGDKADALRPR